MRAEMTLIGNNCSPIVPQIFPRQKRTLRRPLSDLKETTGPPMLLAFVDFLCEFAKLLGLFVACLYL